MWFLLRRGLQALRLLLNHGHHPRSMTFHALDSSRPTRSRGRSTGWFPVTPSRCSRPLMPSCPDWAAISSPIPAEAWVDRAQGGQQGLPVKRDVEPLSTGSVQVGESLQHPPPSLLLRAAGPDHLRATTRRLGVAVASGLAHLTRQVLVRRRPAAADLPAHEALVHKPRSPSFPSAHAAVAAAFTTALARRIGPAGLGVAPVAGPSPTPGCVLGRIGLLTSQSASSRACSWERPCTGR
jgi:hypothetical protein